MAPELVQAIATAAGTLLLALLVEARYRAQERRRELARAERAGRRPSRADDLERGQGDG